MADGWTFSEGQNWEEFGSVAATSLCTVVTPGASGIKGSWAQLGASTTAHPIKLLHVNIAGDAQTASVSTNVDIGVGTTGNEKIIIPDVYKYSAATMNVKWRYVFPVNIPAGTQLNARCSGQTAGASTSVQVLGMNPTFCADSQYGGVNEAIATGTDVTASASTNTKGSWTQLVASSARNYKALMIATQGNTNSGDPSILLDIGVGAGGSEKVVISNIQIHRAGAFIRPAGWLYPIAANIPSGTRISCRIQSTAGSVNVKVAVYGIA